MTAAEEKKSALVGARRSTSKNGLLDGITKQEALRAFVQGSTFVVVMFGLLYAVSTLGFYMRFGGWPWQ